MTPITFDVIGLPKPQGSAKAFAVGGKARVTHSGGADFAAWRNAVSDAARRQAEVHGCLDGALQLVCSFRFPMPKSRPKAVRERGIAWKTSAPDRDKLDRCIGDALTAAGLIRDDALIAAGMSEKHEVTGWTGATITLRRLPDEWLPMEGL